MNNNNRPMTKEEYRINMIILIIGLICLVWVIIFIADCCDEAAKERAYWDNQFRSKSTYSTSSSSGSSSSSSSSSSKSKKTTGSSSSTKSSSTKKSTSKKSTKKSTTVEPDDHDIDTYYEDYKDEFEDEDDAWDDFEDNDDYWDDY